MTHASGTWKYDDPRLKMSHSGAAAWEFCLQDGGVSESFTHKMAATATASIRVIVVLGQSLVAVI